MTEHPREQPLFEGPVGEAGWIYRTAPIAGFIELFGPAGETTLVQALEEPISAVEPFSGEEEGFGVFAIGEGNQRFVRRVEDDQWIAEERDVSDVESER